MDIQSIPGSEPRVIECVAGIAQSRDAMELAYACSDADTDLLLLNSTVLPAEFFQLGTGFAGDFIQRLVNYRVRTAAIFAVDADYPARFREFLIEARRNPRFRAFDDREAALRWLTSATPTK